MEDILDPDLLICDPHIHIWDRPDSCYMIEALKSDTNSGHRVEQVVYVDCGSHYRVDGPESFRCVGETEFIGEYEPTGFISAIVAFADLRLPEIADILAAHKTAGRGRFRGIRNSSAWDAGIPRPSVRLVQRVDAEGEAKMLFVLTFRAIASAVVDEGIATGDEVDATLAGLEAFVADPETLVAQPRIFQIWRRRD